MNRSILVIAILVILSLVGYLFLKEAPLAPSRVLQEETVTAEEAVPITADPGIKQEAESYVSKITSGNQLQIDVKDADDFVAGNQSIALSSGQEIELTTPADLISDPGLSPDAPITLVREEEQIEVVSPAQILDNAHGNLDNKIKILDEGQVREITVGELLEEYPDTSAASLSVIRKVEQFEVTTVKELLEDESIDKESQIKIIRKPYKLSSMTVDELLMGETDVRDGSVYYVKNVTDKDKQGIWGIVHNSLVKNFASGIAIKRQEEIKNYQVEIPKDADERLPNHSSSFLGQMISNKTAKSYVYNYEKGKMGRNPDLVYPGQEIVIISFTPEELIEIYQHFVARSKQ